MDQPEKREESASRVKDQDYWDRFFERDEDPEPETMTLDQLTEISWLSVTEDSGMHRVNDVRRFV
jgi:hypothetical protein